MLESIEDSRQFLFSSKFKGKVYEPVMLHLKLRDPSDAAFLQQSIGRPDLEAFLCEEAEDASELMRRLRTGLGLRRINVAHSPDMRPGEFR